ncbi:response regulator [Octadecabacter sp. G9-8]|uniref:Response regulator n=1 Tax=Octadecabacter dasysiphoniae TaxID=2909341 RepID=A0ABS9CY47_9RHOB|nr:response regulator [Octadecabacter dasysiphoniae]MCF2872068.1 response regulator [Octadecabacter dasysiphoniae]
MNHSTVSFLLVDDDIVSIMSMKRTIKKLRLLNPVVVAGDGLEALDILRQTGDVPEIKHPFIVILDLNMPRMSGHAFMKEIRNDPALSDTIVFIMSTSDSAQDVEEAYRANVAGYILKDGKPNTFRDALELLGTYSEIVLLPKTNAS